MAIFWIVALVVLLIACAIHWFVNDCCDLGDFFDDCGWITFVVVLCVELTVFGFIFWKWWAMLIIVGSIVVVAVVVFVLLMHFLNKYDEYDDSEDEDDEYAPTHYKCPNCGAAVSKFLTDYDYTHAKPIYGYKCLYCGVEFDEKGIKEIAQKARNSNDERGLNGKVGDKTNLNYADLTDFEDEYFMACDRMLFRPYNLHSSKQIERRFEALLEQINNFKDIYDDIDWYNSEDVLQRSFDFLEDNDEEIKEYFDKYGGEEIQNRYQVYCDEK